MSETDETACASEVERLHQILQGWLSGTAPNTASEFAVFADSHTREFTLITAEGVELTRDQVMGGLREAHGSAAGLRIQTAGTRLVAAAGPVLVVTFTELHSGSDGARSRRCTAVFERDPAAPHGLRWRHLQETFLAE
ncbi:hypothetical protein F4561_004138 [Lipingzhangella halophila]|uniref:DUF4440 domain-containing protein n=1 Tax=Lipingzhangella halophila TaxID=1783352 RepID=A0A7W7RJU2_9ACTN|nr:DUF4440 domain-containing protein [Lipingzhangella halophila]MBB4933318.1 hypothetical protein [Lipingzhangella halophila]